MNRSIPSMPMQPVLRGGATLAAGGPVALAERALRERALDELALDERAVAEAQAPHRWREQSS